MEPITCFSKAPNEVNTFKNSVVLGIKLRVKVLSLLILQMKKLKHRTENLLVQSCPVSERGVKAGTRVVSRQKQAALSRGWSYICSWLGPSHVQRLQPEQHPSHTCLPIPLTGWHWSTVTRSLRLIPGPRSRLQLLSAALGHHGMSDLVTSLLRILHWFPFFRGPNPGLLCSSQDPSCPDLSPAVLRSSASSSLQAHSPRPGSGPASVVWRIQCPNRWQLCCRFWDKVRL